MSGPDLLRLPRFADYGPSYPSAFKKGGGIPRAHLRFSSANGYLVAEGPSVEGVGFRAIYDVAEKLTAQDEFHRSDFSRGSSFFQALAQRAVGPGNPAKWRWGAADHHNVLAVWEQASLHGVTLEPEHALVGEDQMEFESILPG
jgi:hypothetical protein